MSNGLRAVLDNDLCVGCGACAFAVGSEMKLDDYGFYKPHFDEGVDALDSEVEKICPFLAPELNEDVLADRFLQQTPHRDEHLGKHIDVFAAHVEEQGFRESGSSGGMGSWIAVELLRLGLVDGVIHAGPVARDHAEDPFFRYQISRTVDEVRSAAHSHYHVVEISQVLAQVKQVPGKYLFVGVPCMVKAIRRAQLADKVVAERIVFAMALVCGHLKSTHWATSLGWATGIEPKDIGAITFRVKSQNVPAKAYFFGIENKQTGVTSVHDSAPITGGKFNLGAMMPEACNYCDDVVGETADLTIGDAWLPRYAFDWQGKNMVVSRNEFLSTIIDNASAEGRIKIDPMTAKEARQAQAGGFRQRREGLAYRLRRAESLGLWAPEKRNLPDIIQPNALRAQIYKLRMDASQKSRHSFRKALNKNDFFIYDRDMKSIFKHLRRLELCVAFFRVLTIKLQALMSGVRS